MRFLESAKQEEEEEESLPLSYKKRSFSKLYQQGQDKLNSEVFRAIVERRKVEEGRRSKRESNSVSRLLQSMLEAAWKVKYLTHLLPYIHSSIHSLHTCTSYARIKKISTESGR